MNRIHGKLLLLLALAAIAMAFIGCESKEPPIIGKWEILHPTTGNGTSMIYEFSKDETATFVGANFTWKTEKDQLTMTQTGKSSNIKKYHFKVSGSNLTLTAEGREIKCQKID